MEWWAVEQSGMIGGILGAAIGGGFGGIGGGVGGPLAAMGKAKVFVLGIFYFGLAVGVLLSGAAIYALIDGQPKHVWYPLLLPGFLMVVLMGGLTPMMHKRYREHDQRKLAAEEVRRSA